MSPIPLPSPSPSLLRSRPLSSPRSFRTRFAVSIASLVFSAVASSTVVVAVVVVSAATFAPVLYHPAKATAAFSSSLSLSSSLSSSSSSSSFFVAVKKTAETTRGVRRDRNGNGNGNGGSVCVLRATAPFSHGDDSDGEAEDDYVDDASEREFGFGGRGRVKDAGLGRTSSLSSSSSSSVSSERRAFLIAACGAASSVAVSSALFPLEYSLVVIPAAAAAAVEEEAAAGGGGNGEEVESIAARAARISKQLEPQEQEKEEEATTAAASMPSTARNQEAKERLAIDSRTAYDFELPVQGRSVPFKELIRQEYLEEGGGGDGTQLTAATAKVKAILVVNIKQDDPLARKNIPELIALAAKYGRNGEFAVICCPTDQGYYEPDTSALIRLKLASEYGYGINPATIITDKVNLLGTGAIPFWRWIQGKCRTPSGLGRIQANFEKFLVDGQSGLPVRRYSRKYMPYDIQDDIEALIKGRPLPPVTADWKEEWRMADRDAERDTYRFQKGLNVFDQ